MRKSLGLYIHIPFCKSKCLYCDFCSFPKKTYDNMKTYTLRVCEDISSYKEKSTDYTVDTVYFGGGTPTLLPKECFELIFCTIRKSFELSRNCEITVECNPATADREKLSFLRDLGVNRLSIGLQSVHENELKALGRAHSFEDFKSIFYQAREAGFDNISADLMYGIPEQTEDSFGESLNTLAELRPEHISTYCLKIEDGTPFSKMEDRLALPDEDTQYNMYLMCTEILKKYGYRKYEISNFSLEGRESKHNMRYWKRLDYIGFGVAAHSCFAGERFGNSRDMDAYLRGENITEERVKLDDLDSIDEFIMLSMRLSEGMEIAELERRTGRTFNAFFPKGQIFINEGFLKLECGRLSFTDKGFFVSNSILSEMIPDRNL